MNIQSEMETSWLKVILKKISKAFYVSTINKINEERKFYNVYPSEEDVFSAYNLTPLNKVTVLIIGQDPYHGENQANGLAFSVNKGIKHPPSLKNILKELVDNYNLQYPESGDLSPWAKQGVLLLNASLTVREGEANSHKNIGWEKITDATIKAVSDNRNNIVFLLWGAFAQKKAKLIDNEKHLVLTSGHPSPLSANKGYWFGNKHFIKTNNYLVEKGKQPINWTL